MVPDRDVLQKTELRTNSLDPVALTERIADWLGNLVGAEGKVEITDVHAPEAGGMSSVTLLFTAGWSVSRVETSKRLVARLPPDESSYPVFPHYDLGLQMEVMRAVAATSSVPVPTVIGVDTTGEIVGAPCGLMEAVEGRAPTDNPPYVFGGWLYDASPADRRALQDATVAVIAGVHEIPPATFPQLVAGGDPLRAHVDEQRAYYEWTRATDGLRIPVLERAFDWLDAHWPQDPGPSVFSWGDARPGNILFDGVTPAAVLDWEMAAIAPRELDLGWVVFIHRFFQDIAEVFELPGLPDFCRPADVVATYEQLTGHTVRDLDWYVVYAALRHGIVMSQIKRRMAHFGEEQLPEHPDDYVMHRAALESLMDGTYAWD
jgi:aminoglycoside phosphotransferase (APT) family kinase protein